MKMLGWLAAVSVTATVGCTSSSSSSTTAPSGRGQIELSVSPTPVSYTGGAGVGGAICRVPYLSRWGPYVLTLRETGGTSVTITALRYLVTTTVAGAQVSDEQITAGVGGFFSGVPNPSLSVPANASLSSRQHFDRRLETNGRPDFPGGKIDFVASGTATRICAGHVDPAGALVAHTRQDLDRSASGDVRFQADVPALKPDTARPERGARVELRISLHTLAPPFPTVTT